VKTGQSIFASLCLLSLLLLAACGGQTHTGSTVLASYVGHWVAHDDELIINADGTGFETWNAGPCASEVTSYPSLCTGIGSLTFRVNANGSLTGTYQSVTYKSSSGQLPPGFQPPTGYPEVGNAIKLQPNGQHLLAAMVNGNHWNYCDPYALSKAECGA
jgi:hypothetical protein